jgi:hypothetical protein
VGIHDPTAAIENVLRAHILGFVVLSGNEVKRQDGKEPIGAVVSEQKPAPYMRRCPELPGGRKEPRDRPV